ncbi:hypothetical protein [Streptomyces platensis]|uniref:hypothetical protein n=1 Tax=Streptomyces platensis TaxID=58346 RepID=UPI0036C09B70
MLLLQWAGEAAWDLDLTQIDYRVRYCGTGMDEGSRSTEERAEAERLARLEHERAAEGERHRVEEQAWCGRLPSEHLKRVAGNVRGMVQLDRLLVDEVDGAAPESAQRNGRGW